MKRPSLPAHIRPARRAIFVLSALFAAGISAASIVGSSSAARADDCVLGLVCPGVTVPPLPTVTLPLPASTTTSSTASTPPTPGRAPASPPAADAPAGQDEAEAFAYTIVGISVRRAGPVRSIHVHLSLSRPATVVAILHRRNIPSVVAVRSAPKGTNKLAVTVPKRVRAGRYMLRLVLGVGSDQYAVTRPISIPK